MKAVYIAIPSLVAFILWVLGGFVMWDFNPGHWAEDGRLLIAFLWVVLSGAGIGAAEGLP